MVEAEKIKILNLEKKDKKPNHIRPPQIIYPPLKPHRQPEKSPKKNGRK